MFRLILIAVLGVFCLRAAEGEHANFTFFRSFGEDELGDISETHMCSSKDGIDKAWVRLDHSVSRGKGHVFLYGWRGVVELDIQYAAGIWKDTSTSIQYTCPDSKIRTQAKVEDFSPSRSEGEAHVAFMPPFSSTVDWFPYVGGVLRPRLYWTCECDGERLTFTRLIFHCREESRAHFFSIDVMLDKLAQGTMSWGDMSLDNKNDRNVVDSRRFDYLRDFSWVPTAFPEEDEGLC